VRKGQKRGREKKTSEKTPEKETQLSEYGQYVKEKQERKIEKLKKPRIPCGPG
jgi:hypothetical protein